MKTIPNVLLLGVILALSQSPSVLAEEGSDCRFSLDSTGLKLEWTAFKTSEKLPVRGTFEKLEVSSSDAASDLATLLNSVSFRMDTVSVSSGDPARNSNIANGFFRQMSGGTWIRGGLQASGQDLKLKAVLLLNGQTKEVPLKGEMNAEGIFVAHGKIDLLSLGLKKSFESIRTLCKELHRGKDGKTKTWSEVEIKVTAPIKKSCR
jgi:hypothetical protein